MTMNNDPSCSNGKGKYEKMGLKCLVPVLVVFAVMFVFQWFYHGVYMMPQYEETKHLWRSQEEMQQLWTVNVSTMLLSAAVISCLYCCVAKGAACSGKCTKTGAKFGLKIGLLLGAHDYASYAWIPVPHSIAVQWFIGSVAMGVLIGVALAFVSRICNQGECKKA